MPEKEWNLFERDSRINIGGTVVHHPIEANIWEFDLPTQVEYLKSVARAGCVTGEEKPEAFVDWIYWKLGQRIAEDYMIPYNRKMFCDELNLLGTYWLDKLPDVSFDEILLSCLEKKAHGKQPGHARFLYPKHYGYGELWLRIADKLGDHIKYGQNVCGIDTDLNVVRTAEGTEYQADMIINTIPWTSFTLSGAVPEDIKDAVSQLKHSSVQIEYFPEDLPSDAHWIYYPEPAVPYHRILLRHNFCPDSRGYWTETNAGRVMKNETGLRSFVYMNEYAYPLNTIGKPELMKKILNWSSGKNIFGLGRWGEWMHYNSDAVVERSLALADAMIN